MKYMSETTAFVAILETEGKLSRSHGLMAVRGGGIIYGTVGGGALEYKVLQDAVSVLEGKAEEGVRTYRSCSGGNARIGILLSDDKEADRIVSLKKPFAVRFEKNCVKALGLEDDEEVAAALEKGEEGLFALNGIPYYAARPLKRLVLIGGGHVAKAVFTLASYLEYDITVIEKRKEFLSEELFPGATMIHVEEYRNLSSLIKESPVTYAAVLTRDIAETELKALSGLRLGYFGVMGHAEFCPWFSPIGLNLGGERVKEVALSLMSEIQSVRCGTNPVSRKYRHGRLVLVRGAGDLATGVIVSLKKAGYRVIATEIENPTVIRRTVSFAEAVYDGKFELDGVIAECTRTLEETVAVLKRGNVPVLIDPELKLLSSVPFDAAVDAILAKKNLGTTKAMAPFVAALGPGFTAGVDCHVVIETKRGHDLGRIITNGTATPNTGVPGIIAGFGKERVIHSPAAGVFRGVKEIGDIVKKGEVVAYVGDVEVKSELDGMLRGLLRTGLEVPKGFKVADVDPRGTEAQFKTVSDKARALGGATLTAIDGFISSLVSNYKKSSIEPWNR
jgi:selenium-dependent molybdenum hydroxylase system protein, YqeB family